MTYRAALIGCGNIGSMYADDPLIKGVYTHAGAYTACAETALVAVCDHDIEKAQACAKKWMVDSVYTDLTKLLQEKRPQIVSVCTPDATHAKVIEQILTSEGVLAILAEKPLALHQVEAQHLVNLARERNVLLAVNYSRRYSVGHQKIKTILESGVIGSIQSVSGYYTKGLFHNGTHWLDLARWLIGDMIELRGFPVEQMEKNEADVHAWLRFANGATGFLQALNANAFSLFEMDIVGEKGRIRIVDSGHRVEYFSVAPSPYYTGYQTLLKWQEVEGDMEDTLLHAVSDLVVSLRQNRQPICSGEDGLAVLNLATILMEPSASANQTTYTR